MTRVRCRLAMDDRKNNDKAETQIELRRNDFNTPSNQMGKGERRP
jgi:hypothetical protein